MSDKGSIIEPHGGYRSLKAFQTAEIVYDGTVKFCERFINPRSRTTDQMVQAARSGKTNVAFMYFYRLLNLFPESSYSADSLFGVGEYYFSIKDYGDAGRTFSEFIMNYPQSGAAPFAIAYILKIARERAQEDLIKRMEKELVVLKQVSLVFRDFAEITYVSPLSNSYKALYFIDKVEIYVNDELFAKVSF